MVACKKLCQRNNTQDGKLAKICDFFSIFGPFDFYLKISGDDKQIIQTTLLIREKFSIYINETCTLTSFEMSEFLSHESNILLTKLSTAKYKCPDEEPLIDTETLNKLKKFEHELDNNTNKSGKEQYDQRFVFIRVKPKFTEKFFLAINIFKNLCEHATSQEFAKINDIYYIVGLFDYLLEINRNNENKIGKTIFRIREILGDYIRDTVTINKIDLPMTNDEIKKIFKNILEKEYILNKSAMYLLYHDLQIILFPVHPCHRMIGKIDNPCNQVHDSYIYGKAYLLVFHCQ